MFNQKVLVSGAQFFSDNDAINVFMDASIPVDVSKAVIEHDHILKALKNAGIEVLRRPAPTDCQDGVYTANWALVRNGKAILARLPNTRQPEQNFAKKYLQELGLEVLELPESIKQFSGQGDSLACGDIIFAQSGYRTSSGAHPYLREWLGFNKVISLETEPAINPVTQQPVINAITGLPDSPTYDIDLALSILKWPEDGKKGLIAYCRDVFKSSSQKILDELDGVDKIVVSRNEAISAYAMNLVSTGKVVIMNSGAPIYQAALESHGLQTVTLDLPELKKGGGSIRCTTLTLS
jgi:N-dimethylarginine dimethylaminohydrolase